MVPSGRNPEDLEYPLQRLRIPSGWAVRYNDLREVEPADVPEDDRCSILHQDLLQMEHKHFNRVLDVGWYGSPIHRDGEYGLVIYEGDFHGRLLYELRTNDHTKLVEEIERLLEEVTYGRI